MLNYSEKLYIVERYFKGTQYDSLLNETLNYHNCGNFCAVERCLNRFPTEEQLFEKLVEKLKGKSVYSTLKSMSESKNSKLVEIKGISSLITHTTIEIEHGNKEYSMLFSTLLEKLNSLIYEI